MIIIVIPDNIGLALAAVKDIRTEFFGEKTVDFHIAE